MQGAEVVILKFVTIRPALDYIYILYFLDEGRKINLNQNGNEEEHITLKEAILVLCVILSEFTFIQCMEQCKRLILHFWTLLVKKGDVETLPDTVASIEACEEKIERILSNLVERYPGSSKVLRAQGAYYEEIKQDLELAQQFYSLADERQEEKRQRKKQTEYFSSV